MPGIEISRNSTRCAIAIFILSLSLNVCGAFLLNNPIDHLYSDMSGYITRAWRLGSGAPFESFDAFYPPGTSLAYAGVFLLFPFSQALKVLVFLQALLLSLANVLVGLSALLLYRRQKTALLVMLASSLYWPFSGQAYYFMAEPLFCFLLSLGFFLFLLSFRSGGSHWQFASLGLVFGLAMLVKGQAGATFAAIFSSVLALPPLRHLRRFLPAACLCLALPVICQFIFTSSILGKPLLSLGVNDAFNTYLGQSRHEAVGCLDPETHAFHIFHNNNSALGVPLLPPKFFMVSILDRSFFAEKTKDLWLENPLRQIIRSVHSIIELWTINPVWPLRNNPTHASFDRIFQYLFLVFAIIPALASLVGALLHRRFFWQVVLCILPSLFISLIAALSMGQPRYLVPFHYSLLLAAIPFYLSWFSSDSLDQGSLTSQRRTQYVGAFLLICAALLFSSLLSHLYSKTIPPRVSGLQNDYETFGQLALSPIFHHLNPEPLCWIETGRDTSLTNSRFPCPAISLQFSGFKPGLPWSRSISWHATTESQGQLSITGTPESFSGVALYLTDGDSFWRSSLVQTAHTEVLASELHDGRWVLLALSPAQIRSGRIDISLSRLTGASVSLSAVAVFAPRSSSDAPS